MKTKCRKEEEKTEKKLKALFDYQRFEKNAGLESLISETMSRYDGELSDGDLSLVSAAGEPVPSFGGVNDLSLREDSHSQDKND